MKSSKPPEHDEDFLQDCIEGDLAHFVDGLIVARAYWRKYRAFVEAHSVPRRLSKVFKEQRKKSPHSYCGEYLLPPVSPDPAVLRKENMSAAISSARWTAEVDAQRRASKIVEIAPAIQ